MNLLDRFSLGLTQDKKPANLVSIFKKFLPLFVLSALLPILIMGVTSPRPLTLFSKATKTPELLLWFEPSSLIVKKDRPFSLNLVAEFADENKVISSLTISLEDNQAFTIDQPQLSYGQSFQGRIVVGTINIVARQGGTFTLDIPQKGVRVPFFESLTVVTTPATITVKE